MTGGARRAGRGDVAAARPRRVLVVDDSRMQRRILAAQIAGAGYEVVEAGSGAEALALCAREPPDLILSDWMMPGMSGLDFCRAFRAMPRDSYGYFILLTSKTEKGKVAQGLDVGADDFLTKPVDRHELRARVRTITRLNRYRTLTEQRENLRLMADRLVAAQEGERRRISRELHDDLGQALTSHMLDIRNLQNDLPLPEAELSERLQTLYQQSREISVKVRDLAQNLRPPALDTLDLKDAMQTFCAEFTRRANIPVAFEADDSLPELSDACNVTLYRVLQEALTNVIKHAQASRVWVDLTLENRTVTLTIQDNGRGFEVKKILSNGIGLEGLRERLAIAGGTFKISSSPVRGTILMAQLPLPDQEAP